VPGPRRRRRAGRARCAPVSAQAGVVRVIPQRVPVGDPGVRGDAADGGHRVGPRRHRDPVPRRIRRAVHDLLVPVGQVAIQPAVGVVNQAVLGPAVRPAVELIRPVRHVGLVPVVEHDDVPGVAFGARPAVTDQVTLAQLIRRDLVDVPVGDQADRVQPGPGQVQAHRHVAGAVRPPAGIADGQLAVRDVAERPDGGRTLDDLAARNRHYFSSPFFFWPGTGRGGAGSAWPDLVHARKPGGTPAPKRGPANGGRQPELTAEHPVHQHRVPGIGRSHGSLFQMMATASWGHGRSVWVAAVRDDWVTDRTFLRARQKRGMRRRRARCFRRRRSPLVTSRLRWSVRSRPWPLGCRERRRGGGGVPPTAVGGWFPPGPALLPGGWRPGTSGAWPPCSAR